MEHHPTQLPGISSIMCDTKKHQTMLPPLVYSGANQNIEAQLKKILDRTAFTTAALPPKPEIRPAVTVCAHHLPLSKPKKASKKISKPATANVPIEQRRRYVCKICSRGFTTSGHLARHNRIHTGEKNHVCPFEGCGQRFSRHDNCVQHYRTHLKTNY